MDHRAPTLVVLLVVSLNAMASAQDDGAYEAPLPRGAKVGIMFESAIGHRAGESEQDEQQRVDSVAAVERTLRSLGYEVVPRADVIKQLVDSDRSCDRGVYRCDARQVLEALELDAVVLIAIWTTRQPSDITLRVTLADAVGQAKARLGAEPHNQVPALLQDALKDVENGRSVRLRINALPRGAETRVDGEFVGLAPLVTEKRYPPGSHEITLTRRQYVTRTKRFEIPRGASSPYVVSVSTEPVGTARADAVMRDREEPTAGWDYALGGGLVALGAAHVVAPLTTLARDGECKDEPTNVGCNKVHFGTASALQLSGGLLAMAAGIYLFVATPIRATLSTDGESLHAQVRASF